MCLEERRDERLSHPARAKLTPKNSETLNNLKRGQMGEFKGALNHLTVTPRLNSLRSFLLYYDHALLFSLFYNIHSSLLLFSDPDSACHLTSHTEDPITIPSIRCPT